ncbi:hypothetical protein [uncultured Propionibacterium sp.]|uniref:hypothetical protein n=1 Tax=uncultured Propionibacterium sp. TaxID=218066 RepID=UPI00292CFEA2|nr:hypothetical protein [uncultured Propionibacterium sp.]
MDADTTIQVYLSCLYAVVLVAFAWVLDALGRRSAQRSRDWRTSNFVFREDHGAWKCHQDQWLWPASFDPEKRVIRYRGQDEICGRCPVKDDCAPSLGPREITQPVDPWPHSEAGVFHRGMSLAIMAAGLALPLAMMFVASGAAQHLALAASAVFVVVAAWPMIHSLRTTPTNAPQDLPFESSAPEGAGSGAAPDSGAGRIVVARGAHGQVQSERAADEASRLIERYAPHWSSGRTRYASAADGADSEGS